MLSHCHPENYSKYNDFHLFDLETEYPVDQWPGNCTAIAYALARHLDIDTSRVVRGHYIGPIDEDGFWGDRKGHPFVQHSWVRSPEGLVLDPTYYSFMDHPPSLYVGHGRQHDPGGNVWRLQQMGPPPSIRKGEASTKLGKDELSPKALSVMNNILGAEGPGRSVEQLRYICNASLLCLQPCAEEIFSVLVDLKGFSAKAWIPQSNYHLIFEMEE